MGEISILTKRKFDGQAKFSPASQFPWVVLPTWKSFFSLLYKNLHLAHEKQNRKDTISKGKNSKSLEPVNFLGCGRNHSSTNSERFSQNNVVTRRKSKIILDLMRKLTHNRVF